jgi:hypothetical protein
VAFDSSYYSVPYNLVHELVEVRSTGAFNDSDFATAGLALARKASGSLNLALSEEADQVCRLLSSI